MRCWILYDEADLEENMFFAESLESNGERLGFDCEIVTEDEIDVIDPADVVVSRTRNADLTFILEDNGATVFNRSSVSRICNDKAHTYAFVRNLGIPVLPFSLPGEPIPEGPPWVVKSRSGHGGTEVFKVSSEKELEKKVSKMDDPLIQQFGDPGKDLRVYVLGGRVIAAVMRTSDKDFRANFKLGGDARPVEVPEEVFDMVRKIVPELLADFVGIDFIFKDGRPYLNEIEDVVGTRMLYKFTRMDPAKLYMEHIARCSGL